MLVDMCVVAAGGAIGAAGRYLVGLAIPPLAAGVHLPGDFPAATFVASFAGCFLIGVLSVLFDAGPWQGKACWRLFAITGILGGFTTFSTFGLETATLLERGAYGMAAANAGISLAACLAGVAAGRVAAKAACGIQP